MTANEYAGVAGVAERDLLLDTHGLVKAVPSVQLAVSITQGESFQPPARYYSDLGAEGPLITDPMGRESSLSAEDAAS